MADRLDQAYTLNFTHIVSVRGALNAERMERALRCLERRHPLLRARIHRASDALSFTLGEAAPIRLVRMDAPEQRLLELATATLAHCQCARETPRDVER